MTDLTITANGKPDGTRVYLDGHDISNTVQGVRWGHDVHGVPKAEVELAVVAGEFASGEVEWFGLDRVPIQALQAELDRREPTR